MHVLDRLLPNILSPGFWKKLWADVKLAWRLTLDPDVPSYLKLIPAVVGVYLLSPFDLIPGFLPIIGQIDDLAILLLGIKLFIRLAPDEVVQRYR